MNWYFLQRVSGPEALHDRFNLRNHLLEALESLLNICSRSDIVLDLIDEWRIWNASWVCRGNIFSAEGHFVSPELYFGLRSRSQTAYFGAWEAIVN